MSLPHDAEVVNRNAHPLQNDSVVLFLDELIEDGTLVGPVLLTDRLDTEIRVDSPRCTAFVLHLGGL